MVELVRWVQAFLLEMERGLLSAYPGWYSSVVPGRPSKELCFSTKGERSGSLKEHGNEVNDGFCSPIYCVWLDPESDLFILGAKMSYRHSDGV
jgi:hypothetical protein